jgi:hypothetical protein
MVESSHRLGFSGRVAEQAKLCIRMKDRYVGVLYYSCLYSGLSFNTRVFPYNRCIDNAAHFHSNHFRHYLLMTFPR